MSKQFADTVKFAFKTSIPVLCGYIFLGIAFGIMLQNAGFSVLWAFIISLVVYAGSMQFVLVNLLSANAPLYTVAVMTLMINSRHLFYGLSFIERFKAMGKRKPYLIFALTDETYSLLSAVTFPEKVNAKNATFLISLFNQCYWIIGSVIGAAAGELIPFDMTGIDFSMTALFTVILIEQIKAAQNKLPVLIGLCSAVLCLLVFGADQFILPSLILTVTVLLLCKPYLLTKTAAKHNAKEGDSNG